jgi:adenine-specific DNA-methyltransferase
MPILNWIGKDAVVNHDKDVPFRLLKEIKSKSVGDSENLIIEGDNLEALKALLPHYQNKIKCIYIDPPYNTGNEKWIYNDNVNSPKIKKWLGNVVGKQDEDLTRHDKWLCMMYPRLKLLRELLSDDGLIFISIDDDEHDNLEIILKEIFGEENFISNIVWQKVYSTKNQSKRISVDHEYIVSYAKNIENADFNLLPRTEKMNNSYKNRDDDPKGPWASGDLISAEERKNGHFIITGPHGDEFDCPPGKHWSYSKINMMKFLNGNKLWFGKTGKNFPRIKQYLNEVQGRKPSTLFLYQEAGHTDEAKKELKKMFKESDEPFPTPKPSRLIKQILHLSSQKNSIILDSFAGSGTTAQAVLELNKEDGGNRKFILVELEPEICKNTTSQRVKNVIKGYEDVSGTGGGFQYAVLDKKLFNSDGTINDECTFEELASYLYFRETKTILDTKKIKKTLLDTHNDTQIHLMFDGIGKNNLDRKFLSTLDKNKDKIIYADKCTLDDSTLEKQKTVFKQIPYEVKKF